MKRPVRLCLLVLPLIAILIMLAVNAQVEKRRAATTRFIALWTDNSGQFASERAKRMTAAQIKKELDQGADINGHAPDGETALMAAADSDTENLSVVRLLLSRGADVNARQIAPSPPRRLHLADLLHPIRFWRAKPTPSPTDTLSTALQSAAKGDDPVIVRLLLEHGADVKATGVGGVTPLMAASVYGQTSNVRLLLDHGANPNASDDAGDVPLSLVLSDSSASRDRLVRLLIERGADPNRADSFGGTPLMRAVGEDRMPDVRLLLAHGAHLEARENENGETALLEAADYGNTAMVAVLLDHGADISVRASDGHTPLMGAAGINDATVALLLKLGAPINVRDNTGRTALMYAADQGGVVRIKALLAHGAKVSLRDKHGQTALSIAKSLRETKIVNLLKAAGAK